MKRDKERGGMRMSEKSTEREGEARHRKREKG